MLERAVNLLSTEGYYLAKRLKNKYYIIRRQELGAGFFSNYYWVLGHVVFARKSGYIPVVDMLHYKTLYSEDHPVKGEMNAWNYYFENVGEIGLEEAYESGRYVFGKDEPLHKYANKFCDAVYRFPSGRAIDYYYPVIQEHIRIKESILKDFRQEWDHKTAGAGRIIGMHIRGTDMKNNLGHPMPADTQEYLRKAEQLLEQDQTVQGIFLATDERKIVDIFQEHFRGKCRVVVNEAFRSEEQKTQRQTGIHEQVIEHPRENHKYRMGMEVLRDAWCLSECDYLICGHSNITNVVILWNHHRFQEVICVEKTSQNLL